MDVKVDVDSTAVYTNRFGYPAVVLNNDATLTITGSSISANNTTIALPQLAFYPSFAGLFTDPGGNANVSTLPSGGSITLQINTVATTHGAAARVGDTVSLADFAPATSALEPLSGSDGTTYNQVNTSIRAALSPVPEPSSFVLRALAGLSGLIVSRSRRKNPG